MTPPPTPAEPRRVLRTAACRAGIALERDVALADLADYLQEPQTTIWVEIQDPLPDDLQQLGDRFGFHPLALEDVSKGSQRPKIDEYKGYVLLVTHAVVPGSDPRDLETREVDLFIGRNYVVALHKGPVPALDEGFARWLRGGGMLKEGVGFLVYTAVDAIIDGYFPAVDAIENELGKAEAEIFAGAGADVADLLRLKRTLFTLRRVLQPLREAFHLFLRREQPLFSPGTVVYFRDVYDHILRILDVVEVERDRVAGTLEANLSVQSNRLNRTMKTLTVVTVSVAIVGSVFGAWGMNFDHLPWTGEPWGFWLVTLGTVAGLAAGFGVARWRGWL